jgi:hypothetical protein
MAFLTDRTLATGVTLQDLIHIVITGDTSQNPAGSSYKATIQQVSDAILFGFTGSTDYYVTGGTYSGGTLVLDRQNGSVTITGFTTGSTQLYEVGSGVGSTQRIGVSADASGDYSLVGGGTGNTSSGNYSFVGGGFCNTATNLCSTVSGGKSNTASGYSSFVGGGQTNTSTGGASLVSGGFANTASNSYSTVGGGGQNRSIGCSSTVSGGLQNTASCNYSFVGGGSINKSICNYSTVIGGSGNTASNLYSFVGGGQLNTASGIHSVVVGGEQNKATSFCNFVGGGGQNTALGFRTTIAGGRSNTTSSTYSIIGGGWGNKAICTTSVIGGGRFNVACGDNTSILGGVNNTSISNFGTILGGSGNTVNHIMSATYGKDVVSVSACTFHVNYLALQNTPETDVQTTTQYLTRDSATGVIKTKLNPGPTVYGLFTQTGDSVVVSATTDETTVIGAGVGTLLVPPNGFSIGDSFRIKMGGVISNPSNNDIRIRLKSGSVDLGDSLFQNLSTHSNDTWCLDIDFIIRNIGGTGTASIMTIGSFATTKKNGGDIQGFSFETLNNTTFNTTISNTLNITVEWDQVDSGDIIYSRTFVLNKIY